MFVKIKQETGWYKGKVGCVYEIMDKSGGNYYRLKEDKHKLMYKKDCEVIEPILKVRCIDTPPFSNLQYRGMYYVFSYDDNSYTILKDDTLIPYSKTRFKILEDYKTPTPKQLKKEDFYNIKIHVPIPMMTPIYHPSPIAIYDFDKTKPNKKKTSKDILEDLDTVISNNAKSKSKLKKKRKKSNINLDDIFNI
jgi:hypothetical protein